MNHLMITQDPWYNWIEIEKKTLESRTSKNKREPYKKVHIGDFLYPKRPSIPKIDMKIEVIGVKDFKGPIIFDTMREYKDEICIDDTYINSKKEKGCQYLTLIWLGRVRKIEPFEFVKHDQRAWIVDFNPNQRCNALF